MTSSRVVIRFEPMHEIAGYFGPAWRIRAANHWFAVNRVGDSYTQFKSLWWGIAMAILYWSMSPEGEVTP